MRARQDSTGHRQHIPLGSRLCHDMRREARISLTTPAFAGTDSPKNAALACSLSTIVNCFEQAVIARRIPHCANCPSHLSCVRMLCPKAFVCCLVTLSRACTPSTTPVSSSAHGYFRAIAGHVERCHPVVPWKSLVLILFQHQVNAHWKEAHRVCTSMLPSSCRRGIALGLSL